MKRGPRISGVALLALAAVFSLACGGGDEEGPFSKFTSRYHKVATGTVSQLDKDKKTMVVTGKKGVPATISWNDQTKMEGDLADGANVSVTYKMKADARIATSVKVRPAAGAPAGSTATAAPAATTSAATTGAKPEPKK